MIRSCIDNFKFIFLGAALGACICFGVLSFSSDNQADERLVELKYELFDQTEALELVRADIDGKLDHVTTRVADLQARMQRIDALGEHLTYVAGIENGEFDFNAPIPSGGPAATEDAATHHSDSAESSFKAPELNIVELDKLLESMDDALRNRQIQLTLLANEIKYLEQHKQNRITGKPVISGWLSSTYGYRNDPFTGKKAWHNGVDFAGKSGSDIVAVAGGVVTKSELQKGYGHLVEISHVDGYITRYGHNKKNLVKQGEVVEKGQKIAIMGSTGRSTGPHVHFEVLKNGKSYDPARYLRRASL